MCDNLHNFFPTYIFFEGERTKSEYEVFKNALCFRLIIFWVTFFFSFFFLLFEVLSRGKHTHAMQHHHIYYRPAPSSSSCHFFVSPMKDFFFSKHGTEFAPQPRPITRPRLTWPRPVRLRTRDWLRKSLFFSAFRRNTDRARPWERERMRKCIAFNFLLFYFLGCFNLYTVQGWIILYRL